MNSDDKLQLVAPCGLYCGSCPLYKARTDRALAEKIAQQRGIQVEDLPVCLGCKAQQGHIPVMGEPICGTYDCVINQRGLRFCYECEDFPCKNLKHIDKRYKTNFKMSMIENLEFIKKHGIKDFLENEDKKWKCPNCGEIICCHNGICFNCEYDKLKNKEKLYRWSD